MQTYLLGHHFSKLLNWFVYFVLDAFDEQTVAIRTVDVHKVSCFLEIHTTALIAVDKHHKRIHLSTDVFVMCWCSLVVFNGEERMMKIHVLVHIQGQQNFLPFFEEMLSSGLSLRNLDIRIRHQPLGLRLLLLLNILSSQLLNQIEIYG